MTHSATIYAHPEMCHNPLDIATLERETGRVLHRKGNNFILLSGDMNAVPVENSRRFYAIDFPTKKHRR